MLTYVGHILLLLILDELLISFNEVFFDCVCSVEVLGTTWLIQTHHILLTKMVHKSSSCLVVANMWADELLHSVGFGIYCLVQFGVIGHSFWILIEFLNMIELALYQLCVLLLFVTLWIQPFLGVLHIMNIMQPRLIALPILLLLNIIISIIITSHSIHYHSMGLVLFLDLAHSGKVVFVYGLGLTLFAGTTVLGTRCHYLEVLAHRSIETLVMSVQARRVPKYLHILHATTEMLQFAARVSIVTWVNWVVGAHSFDNEAIFDNLVHVWLLPM